MENNIKLFKWFSFFSGTWILAALAVVYFKEITGTYGMAMAIWSICSLSQTCMEIPTGVLSDRIGRKKTLILVSILIFISFFFWAFAGQSKLISMLIFGGFFYGCSNAMLSGTLEAFIYETLKDLKKEKDFDLVYSKVQIYGQLGLSVAALSAIIISFYFSIYTLAWISIIPTIFEIIIACCMMETRNRYNNRYKKSFEAIIISFRYFMKNKKLRFYSIIRILEGSLESAVHRFEGAYFKELIPDWLINFIRFLKQLFGILGFYLMTWLRRIPNTKLYFCCIALNIIFRSISVITNNFVSPFLMAFVNIFYGPTVTSNADILQHEYSNFHRVTMQSLIAFVQGIFSALLLYIFGVLADFTSPQIAIFLAICLKIFILLTSGIVLKKNSI